MHISSGGMSGMHFGGSNSFGGLGASGSHFDAGPGLGSSRAGSTFSNSGRGIGNFDGGSSARSFNGGPGGSRSISASNFHSGSLNSLSHSGNFNGHNWANGEHFAHAQNNWNHNWNNHWNNWNNWHNHNNFWGWGWWWPVAWGWGWGWPWWGWGWGGYGGGGYCYYCPDYSWYDNVGYYGAGYGGASPGYEVAVAPSVTQTAPNAMQQEYLPSQSQYATAPPQPGEAGQQDASQGAAFFAQAEDAFRQGNYRDAIKMANHAAVESPRNPKSAELMSLSSFASGDYRTAAAQARAALALGPPADWRTLYSYYGDDQAYTTQLRNLEKYVKDNASAPEGHFLLGYQYLMTGFNKQAMKQFDEVQKIAPNDKFTSELVQKLNGQSPEGEALPTPPAPSARAPEGELPLPPQNGGGRGT
jgi:tetratricopeptide (TPR) repeat protein